MELDYKHRFMTCHQKLFLTQQQKHTHTHKNVQSFKTKKTKQKQQTNKQNQTDRTLGQMVKAKLYRQNLTQKHTHTHSQKKEKGRN